MQVEDVYVHVEGTGDPKSSTLLQLVEFPFTVLMILSNIKS